MLSFRGKTYSFLKILFLDCSYLPFDCKGISNINYEKELYKLHNFPDVLTLDLITLHVCLVLSRFHV